MDLPQEDTEKEIKRKDMHEMCTNIEYKNAIYTHACPKIITPFEIQMYINNNT